ncbi:MAG: hypothetical protein C0500_07600 [Sphingobium sp.]|nr:hypothetical protein [Sphingobium sp.]
MAMPPTTIALIAIAVVILLIGIAIGYFGNDRAAVWRRRFEDERDNYADYRARSEARHARMVAALMAGPMPLPSTQAPPPSPAAPLPISGTRPAPEITHIVGIDAALADRLAALGVTTIRDIATLTIEDELALELRLGLNAGTIARDQWRSQAQLLDSGPAALAG